MFLTEEKVKGIGDFDDFCMPSKISEQWTGVFSTELGGLGKFHIEEQ